jgi:hypothetical protein
VKIANGEAMSLKSQIEEPLEIQDYVIPVKLCVTDQLSVDAILGMDVFTQFSSLQMGGCGPDLVVSIQHSDLVQKFQHLFDQLMPRACLTGVEMK